jgi:transposase
MSRPARTDEQGAVSEPLLPARRRGPGRPRADERKPVTGMLYVRQTDCTWETLPREDGSAVTCWRRVQPWSPDGTWGHVGRALLSALDARARWRGPERSAMAASYRPQRGLRCRPDHDRNGAKVLVVADGQGLPLGRQVASARPHARTLAVPTLAPVQGLQRRGRPRTRPQALIADGPAYRPQLRRLGIKPLLPPVARVGSAPPRTATSPRPQ